MPKKNKPKKTGRPHVDPAKKKVQVSLTWAPKLLTEFDDFLRDLWGTDRVAVDRSRGVSAAVEMVMEHPDTQKLFVEKLKG